jgi:hypothetical protein
VTSGSSHGREQSERKRTVAIGDGERRLARDSRVLFRTSRHFVVVLGPGVVDPVVLRGTGIALWAALDQPRSLQALADSLAATFDADPVDVRADIAPVIERLCDAAVLRVVT